MVNTVLFTPLTEDDLRSLFLDAAKVLLQQYTREQEKEQLLSPSQVCALFKPKISKTTLAKYTKEGKLEAFRIPGSPKVLYRYSSVLKSLERIRKYERQAIPA